MLVVSRGTTRAGRSREPARGPGLAVIRSAAERRSAACLGCGHFRGQQITVNERAVMLPGVRGESKSDLSSATTTTLQSGEQNVARGRLRT